MTWQEPEEPTQRPPYGQPAQPYAPPPAGAAPVTPAAAPPSTIQLPPGVQYASYGARVGATLLDSLFASLLFLPAIIPIAVAAGAAAPGEDPPVWMWFAFGLLLLVGLAVVVWNQAWRMGSIGQSWGKQVVGIHLVNKDTTRPPGGWIGVAKWVIRQVLGNVTCGLYTIVSYLFPLWEQHKRTVDDMIVGTIVVRYPDGRVPV